MSSGFNINDISRLAQKLLDERDQGQEFMLDDICQQTKRAYEKFPEDPVIRQVAFVVERMADRLPRFSTISQADISKIHNEVAGLSSNSHFRTVLGHLLLNRPQKTVATNNFVQMNRIDVDKGIDTSDLIDKALVDNFGSALDGRDKFTTYNQKTADTGAKYVQLELNSLGFKNINVNLAGGNESTLIYTASFDTARGPIGVNIPIDLQNGKLIFPSTFIAGDKLETLTAKNIKNFLEVRSNQRNPELNKRAEESDVKIALDFGTQIAGTEQKAEMPKELAHLARDFEENIVASASVFGSKAVNSGKKLVARELILAGFKNAQVCFGSEGNDSIIYLATINTPRGAIEIEVPVEMQKTSGTYLPLAPAYFAYDGLIEDFTASKLQRFAIKLPVNSSGNKACTTAYNYMTLPELKDEILKSASENDYVSCEMVLGHVEDKFTEEDYKNAVADYQYLLMAKASMSKRTQHHCSKMIPAGQGSIYARCGHYLVSMDKVVADTNGECILKTSVERERLNPIDESGAFISTSKINFT